MWEKGRGNEGEKNKCWKKEWFSSMIVTIHDIDDDRPDQFLTLPLSPSCSPSCSATLTFAFDISQKKLSGLTGLWFDVEVFNEQSSLHEWMPSIQTNNFFLFSSKLLTFFPHFFPLFFRTIHSMNFRYIWESTETELHQSRPTVNSMHLSVK